MGNQLSIIQKKFTSKKRKTEHEIQPTLPKKQKLQSTNIDTLMENPGFSHLVENILLHLDHKDLQTCRLVCHSWKNQIDQPHLWIMKCNQRGQSKDLIAAWFDLVLRIEKGSFLEKELGNCIMTWHGLNHTYSEKSLRGITPVHIAANCGFIEIVKFIASFKKNLNAPKRNGVTPMYAAARKGHLDIVKFIGEQIENSYATEIRGWTPIQLAATNGHTKLVKYLAEKLGNPNSEPTSDGWWTIHLAAQQGHIDIVKYLAHFKNFDVPNSLGWTTMHFAADGGNIEVVKYLASQVENPNPLQPNGWTPIHSAARAGHVEIVNYLGSIVDNPNAPDQNGWTPLHVAAHEGQIEVIQSPIFTSNPRNYTLPLPNGQTPINVAARNNHPEVAKMILKIITDMFQTHPDEILNALM